MITLLHQAVVLPVCVAMWLAGTPAAPEIIYLLTGAYLASDSIMNYTPVSGCVVGAISLTVPPTVTLTLSLTLTLTLTIPYPASRRISFVACSITLLPAQLAMKEGTNGS